MNLTNFLNDVPLPLTTLLIQTAPYISFIRFLLYCTTWNPPFYPSCLLLAIWWFACLLLDQVLCYLLPLVLFSLSIAAQWVSLQKSAQPLVTDLAIQSTISDLQSIQLLLPSLPSLPDRHTLARILLLLYIPYLVLTHYVRLRILIALVGTALLTYRAPWVKLLRGIVWKSAYIRWSIYYLWSQLSGQALSFNLSPLDVDSSSTKPVNTLRFLFTIHENQRWWMGLDWTAALLPGERPSWCSVTQQPVSPPNAFPLPRTSVITMRDGEGKLAKRTAIWRWEEPEWRVVVRRGDGGASRMERPLPSLEKEPANRSVKGRRQDPTDQSVPTGLEGINASSEVHEDDAEPVGLDDPVTDPDGWVYGDNKWENLSSKGGISKYTRFRRWTRIAVVREAVEVLEEEWNENARPGTADSLGSTVTHATAALDMNSGNSQLRHTSPLRQRLISALKRPGNSRDD